MAIARRLTRGLGEKIQTKEIRCGQYPQIGLRDAILPDPPNIKLSGADITSINVWHSSFPAMINSYLNPKIRSPIPFTGTTKGSDGRGVYFPVSSGRSAQALSLCADKKVATNFCVTEIYSFSYSANVRLRNKALIANGQLDDCYALSFDALQGGVTKGVDYKKDGKVFLYSEFQGFTDTAFIPGGDCLYYPTKSNGYQYNIGFPNDLMDGYGTLSYSQTNTNQNNNASWLLNQRTQYQRQFNKLFNLGV